MKNALNPYKHYVILPALLMLCMACRSSKMDMEKLQAYLQDEYHGLVQTWNDNLHSVRVSFLPSDIIIQQLLRNSPVSKDSLEALQKIYFNYYYFNLELSYNGNEMINKFLYDRKRYGKAIEDLSFNMQEYVFLTTEKYDTIPLVDALFTRYYGITHNNCVQLVFPNTKVEDAEELGINLDGRFLDLGKLVFTFHRRDIEKVPGLRFDNIEQKRNNNKKQ